MSGSPAPKAEGTTKVKGVANGRELKASQKRALENLSGPRRVEQTAPQKPAQAATVREHEDAGFEADGSAESRGMLVLKYRLKARKLARSILRKWHARLDLQEVDSLVDLSLCEAVKRYDPSKGASFMTFMFFHLRGNLIRAVAGAVNAHSVPVWEDDQAKKEKASKDGESTHRSVYRVATASEVAEALCSHDRKLPDELLFKKELVAISTEACARLDPLEREVISRIYLQEQQLLDIADTLGYSRCHISRVKKRALEALYEDLSRSVPFETSGRRPSFEEEEEGERPLGVVRASERRAVRRRRPRSGKGVSAGAVANV